ncbi:MAG: Asp-tRNA(Asn)/Glu-tRNA(Gln) amidotransferase subunit GatB [Ureaplasma sp.]|nr:Asp-tRNA(Asn)/Glu-tRNA(Gln) amidotransferase subunit GatB [Ureaplasma sp.]
MIQNFEVIIGIEVHAALNTKTKMFSSSLNSHNSKPNTNINEIDLGLPGTMPRPNKEAIVKAIWLANELKMQTHHHNICFDRKNYYYLDLPKGFQITQQYNPIATNGYIEILDANNNLKKIEIERFHLEEDTAKQFNENNKIYLDYNRCGSPLIEIVTKPCINSSYEAAEYLKQLILILKYLNISDAKLEEGSLRADVNISLRLIGDKNYGTKVEIKNINSVSNVAKAIEFEIQRQSKMILSNIPIEQETRKFDDKTNQTLHLRSKQNAVNYRYIYEPNILSIRLSENDIKEFISRKPKGLKEIKSELKQSNLDEEMISNLLNNFALFNLFNIVKQKINDHILVYKWLSVELLGILNKQNLKIEDLEQIKIERIIKALDLLIKEDVNGKQAKIIFDQIINSNKTVQEIIKDNGMEQIKDESLIEKIIIEAIQQNPEMINSYSSRPERTEKFIIGYVMKQTKAQANPMITDKVMKKVLSQKVKN